MNKTKIPWANWSWNPIVGCSPASEGCANCYAAAISKRFHLPWGSAHFKPDRLDQPAKVRKPGRVFVCSMADIGHETVRPEWRRAIHDAMIRAPWHTYIVLTKRPGAWFSMLPSSCWVGVTVENQAQAEARIPLLLKTQPITLRFVSVEPMLEPVTLRRVRFPTGVVEDVINTEVSNYAKPLIGKLNGIDWVIAGPETGPKARPCKDEWIDALAVESPCFFDKREPIDGIREYPK